MSRVATIPLQRTMSDAIQRAQEKLAVSQQQLASTKKASDFASLGTETVRNLSAHSLLARQDAQSTISKRVGTTLSLYQGQIEGVQDSIEDLKKQITTAVGTGQSAGLQEAIQAAFTQFRSSLNSSEGGTPLFAGSATETTPFTPNTLADAATISGDDAFRDNSDLASARVADGVDVTYGISASALGKQMYEAFRTLAQAGDIGDKPTDAQMQALQKVVGQIDTGLGDLRAVNAENGRKQNQVETLAKRGDERSLLLNGIIENNEDADLGQVAVDIAQRTTVLQASYSVFSKLSGLSLVNYMN
jgi:flagellar hook-associated protein 3 FlgL